MLPTKRQSSGRSLTSSWRELASNRRTYNRHRQGVIRAPRLPGWGDRPELDEDGLSLADGLLFRFTNATFMHFLSVDPDRVRRGNAKPNLVAINGNDGDGDVAVDYDLFANSASEHQHEKPPC